MSTHSHTHGPAATSVRHLGQRDVAARWRLSVRTLERWRACRKGPPFLKLGGKVVYCIDDIEEFEKMQRQGTTPL